MLKRHELKIVCGRNESRRNWKSYMKYEMGYVEADFFLDLLIMKHDIGRWKMKCDIDWWKIRIMKYEIGWWKIRWDK